MFRGKLSERLAVHTGRAGALINLRQTAADLMEITIRLHRSNEAFEVKREPYWVEAETVGSILGMSASAVTRFLPKGMRESRARNQLAADTKKAVLRNIANLDWAIRQMRSRVIADIEFIINNPGPALGQRKWTSKGAECSVERHSFAGEVYSFHVNILHVRLPPAGSPKWKLLIIGEFWQSGEGESIHSTKWLKLLHGKPGDVLKWISANRASVSPSTSDSVKS